MDIGPGIATLWNRTWPVARVAFESAKFTVDAAGTVAPATKA